jgi:hypothetical protein
MESIRLEVAGQGMGKQFAAAIAEVAAVAGVAVVGGSARGFVMGNGRLREKNADEGSWGLMKEGPLCCL